MIKSTGILNAHRAGHRLDPFCTFCGCHLQYFIILILSMCRSDPFALLNESLIVEIIALMKKLRFLLIVSKKMLDKNFLRKHAMFCLKSS